MACSYYLTYHLTTSSDGMLDKTNFRNQLFLVIEHKSISHSTHQNIDLPVVFIYTGYINYSTTYLLF